MSRLVLMEVAMREQLPDLYDIYFGGQVLLHYNDDIPFIVVATTPNMGKVAALELLSGCKAFKAYHKHLFGNEVKSFVTDHKKFNKINDWWRYFHPRGIYR